MSAPHPSAAEHGQNGGQTLEKHDEKASHVHEEDVVDAAARGHAATDAHGHSLVHFDPEAERRLVRKIDFYVVPTVAMLYLWCFIDRANIGNARLAGLEKDLGLKGYQYNILLTSFYISYIVFEIPCNLLCKVVGPGKWLPFLTFGFGLFSMLTGFATNFSNAAAIRFLLGIFESGMLPGIAYYLSRWYRKAELGFRLALYIVMAPLAGAFGGLLASGILKLNGMGKVHTWQQLFVVEGIITMGLAIISYFTLTDRPSTARWLSDEEKALAIARVKSENVGTTEVLDKIDTKKVMRGIFNPNTILTSVIFLFDNITVQGLAFFLPTIVATIYPNATVIKKQLHTVPPYIVGAFFVVAIPFMTWKTGRSLPFFVFSAPLMMIGYIMFLASKNPQVRYGATFLITSGAFVFGPLCNAQVATNALTDTARSSAIGMNVMLGNIGGLISTWAFLPFDGPNYPIGNGLNLATSSMILILSLVLWAYLIADNRRRAKIDVDTKLAGMTEKQISDLDWKHPGHRWRY
ncbi:MFS transporter [Cutaneotrichosporon oleaginosum]|uniref:MFS transporter n=1 Tax=Cutaneotrichosporon oleaginosum TaxID=879819 RepID=A0A0J0XHF0_9TREE|nr:MFS transporter [Cutaneotrichosporon oleaginosum]KLT40521.1 MFS transporter [Cutaneotrichosporon oleaginosum]TXT08407.1 hypothetical protein COLE_05331 [Cutaneotrichosporon oleaginosum]